MTQNLTFPIDFLHFFDFVYVGIPEYTAPTREYTRDINKVNPRERLAYFTEVMARLRPYAHEFIVQRAVNGCNGGAGLGWMCP